MTKDEARESYLNARDRVFHGGLVGIELFRARQDEVKVADAYAQACVDAALADTLGMLEALAKMGLDIFVNGAKPLRVYGGKRLRWTRFEGVYAYGHNERISRAEAEALLAGEEKKE